MIERYQIVKNSVKWFQDHLSFDLYSTNLYNTLGRKFQIFNIRERLVRICDVFRLW